MSDSLSPNISDGNTAFLRAARAGHLDKVLEHLKANIDINTSNSNGLNALHLASKDGHVHVVTELLKRGAVVDAATKKGNTALHIASLAGQEEVVKLLVATGAAVNVQSQNGFTPLYMAAQENHDNVVRFLLANEANQSLATEDGFTPLAVAMQQGHDKVVAVLLENDTRGKVRLPALHIAAKKDDCKAAALLLQNNHNPDVTSKSGFTPLHIAAHYGNESIANLLLNRGADVNYAAKHNITPLHVAAKWGKTNMVSLLLEKGANIESKTRDGLTPLHCAARSGHEQVVDMMLERGAPISSKTKNGLAPLHMASQGDHVDAARILLYHRASVDEVTVDYLTALHVAAHCGHVRVAKLLLDRKADPNARALNGFTPLHIACKKNRIKVVELLLKHGASIEATTESGLTPLHVASFMGCMNIVIYLLQHEANPDVPTVRGETPLHLAARANQTDIIRILLRNGAQVDARAREQQTPLHIASRLGNVDIVMLLLQHGAAVDSTTKDLYTALHIAGKEGQEEVAAVLLEHGASLTATTKKGFTPLHLAAKYGNMKVAKLVLQRDAPVDAQGKNGVTPLHVASHYDHQNVALLLLDKGASPHATAKNGHTPLHIAARKNQMDIATTLLEYGAKANAESKAGFTPLHLSSQEGHTDMSTLLIEHQADTNHKAKNGLTPLHLCAQEDRVNVAAILVKNGAQVESITKAGYTPLHVASHFGQGNMVRFLLQQGGDVKASTNIGYTPLHQASQQGHTTIVNLLLENAAQPNSVTSQGQTALSIAQKLGYISVVESLKVVTDPSVSSNATLGADEKYRVVAPESMQETFMSDSEDEGGEDTMLSDQPYRYLTVDEMKSLGDDSLPIDVTRDERMDSNRECMAPPTAVDDTISPQHTKDTYQQFAVNYTPDNVDIGRHPLNVGKLHWKNFLVSFLVDARGGAMRGCRHSGVRVIVPPRKATMPMRVTCRYLKRDKLSHPPPLMEGEALASRILELGPVGAKFLGPVIIEVPHFGSLRGMEREIVILRSDNGETWREHTLEASDDAVHQVLNDSFEGEELSALEEVNAGRTTRILTTDFPQYFAVVSRIRQEVHAIGPEGGMVSSSVVPQVQAVFPQGALTKKIKVGLQAQPVPAELTAKLLGNRVAVSPIVTVEPRRRKFHKPITLTIPVPQAANKGMINQYSGDAPTLRLLCSITGGTTRAQWEDVTGSTPLTFVNDCVSFTTTVSARFWLMDCRNIGEATKMATELYKEAIHVPFMAKFVVFSKRVDILEARLRVFCMTDDKEDKTLEHQEHFLEVAKSRDVEVLEGKSQYVEFAGNLVPVTKSGDQLQLGFRAFRENRLPFTVRVKDPHADTVGRILFMKEAKVAKGEPPQQPICILNIVLPESILPESGVAEPDIVALHNKYTFLKDGGLSRGDVYQRTDLRLSDISNLLGDDWVLLASELKVSTSDVNSIKTEYPSSGAQQAMAMLRLWLQQSGNKATGNALETALRKVGREDIVQQCIFNVDEIDRTHLDQSGFDSLKEELGPSRDTSLRRDVSLDITYDEQDIMKESESVEELVEAEKKEPYQDKNITNISGTKDDVEKQTTDVDETKYIGEEKVVEEERKSVAELKEIFAQDKRDRQYERQPRPFSDKETPPQSADDVTQRATTTIDDDTTTTQEVRRIMSIPISDIPDRLKDDDTSRIIPSPSDTLAPHMASEADQRRDSELFQGVSEELVRLETTYKVTPAEEESEVLSPKVSKTPPPSPAEFKDTTGVTTWQTSDSLTTAEQPLSSQVTSASPQDDDDSLDTDGFQEQFLLETPPPHEDKPVIQRTPRRPQRLLEMTLGDNIPHRGEMGERREIASGEDSELGEEYDYNITEEDFVDTESHSELRTLDQSSDITLSLRDIKVYDTGQDFSDGKEEDKTSVDCLERTRPVKLKIRGINSPDEEKGVKDSKKREHIKQIERQRSENIQEFVGKRKVFHQVERLSGGVGVGKEFPNGTKETPHKGNDTDMLEHKGQEDDLDKYIGLKESNDEKQPSKNNIAEYNKHIDRGTSPFNDKALSSPNPQPRFDPPLLSSSGRLNQPPPTLELVIGRKEVHTREATATAESRLTLYGPRDVEISIRSQSHISVTTTRREASGKETSEKVDVGMTATAGTGSTGKTQWASSTEEPEYETHDVYIIPPGPEKEVVGDHPDVTEINKDKKREETVIFSGKKSVYRYESLEAAGTPAFESPTTEESVSHHITDTGISLTRGTLTDTITSPIQQPPGDIYIEDKGFISDTAVDVNCVEETELTDAGLSPIQADDIGLGIPNSDLMFLEEEIILTHFCDTASSPVEFQVESTSVALSPLQIETSEASVSTDKVDTKDASVSPIQSDKKTILQEQVQISMSDISHSLDKSRGDEVFDSTRRDSGDVKTLIRLIEQSSTQRLQDKHVAIISKESKKSKEEQVYEEKAVQKSLTDYKIHKPISLPPEVEKIDTNIPLNLIEQESETVQQIIEYVTLEGKTKPTTPKHIGPKIKELQKIFSQSTESEDTEKSEDIVFLEKQVMLPKHQLLSSENINKEIDKQIENDKYEIRKITHYNIKAGDLENQEKALINTMLEQTKVAQEEVVFLEEIKDDEIKDDEMYPHISTVIANIEKRIATEKIITPKYMIPIQKLDQPQDKKKDDILCEKENEQKDHVEGILTKLTNAEENVLHETEKIITYAEESARPKFFQETSKMYDKEINNHFIYDSSKNTVRKDLGNQRNQETEKRYDIKYTTDEDDKIDSKLIKLEEGNISDYLGEKYENKKQKERDCIEKRKLPTKKYNINEYNIMSENQIGKNITEYIEKEKIIESHILKESIISLDKEAVTEAFTKRLKSLGDIGTVLETELIKKEETKSLEVTRTKKVTTDIKCVSKGEEKYVIPKQLEVSKVESEVELIKALEEDIVVEFKDYKTTTSEEEPTKEESEKHEQQLSEKEVPPSDGKLVVNDIAKTLELIPVKEDTIEPKHVSVDVRSEFDSKFAVEILKEDISDSKLMDVGKVVLSDFVEAIDIAMKDEEALVEEVVSVVESTDEKILTREVGLILDTKKISPAEIVTHELIVESETSTVFSKLDVKDDEIKLFDGETLKDEGVSVSREISDFDTIEDKEELPQESMKTGVTLDQVSPSVVAIISEEAESLSVVESQISPDKDIIIDTKESSEAKFLVHDVEELPDVIVKEDQIKPSVFEESSTEEDGTKVTKESIQSIHVMEEEKLGVDGELIDEKIVAEDFVAAKIVESPTKTKVSTATEEKPSDIEFKVSDTAYEGDLIDVENINVSVPSPITSPTEGIFKISEAKHDPPILGAIVIDSSAADKASFEPSVEKEPSLEVRFEEILMTPTTEQVGESIIVESHEEGVSKEFLKVSKVPLTEGEVSTFAQEILQPMAIIDKFLDIEIINKEKTAQLDDTVNPKFTPAISILNREELDIIPDILEVSKVIPEEEVVTALDENILGLTKYYKTTADENDILDLDSETSFDKTKSSLVSLNQNSIFSITPLHYDSFATETGVNVLITEVKEATRQIKEEIKELKPDLTPTPDGNESVLPMSNSLKFSESSELDDIKDLQIVGYQYKSSSVSVNKSECSSFYSAMTPSNPISDADIKLHDSSNYFGNGKQSVALGDISFDIKKVHASNEIDKESFFHENLPAQPILASHSVFGVSSEDIVMTDDILKVTLTEDSGDTRDCKTEGKILKTKSGTTYVELDSCGEKSICFCEDVISSVSLSFAPQPSTSFSEKVGEDAVSDYCGDVSQENKCHDFHISKKNKERHFKVISDDKQKKLSAYDINIGTRKIDDRASTPHKVRIEKTSPFTIPTGAISKYESRQKGYMASTLSRDLKVDHSVAERNAYFSRESSLKRHISDRDESTSSSSSPTKSFSQKKPLHVTENISMVSKSPKKVMTKKFQSQGLLEDTYSNSDAVMANPLLLKDKTPDMVRNSLTFTRSDAYSSTPVSTSSRKALSEFKIRPIDVSLKQCQDSAFISDKSSTIYLEKKLMSQGLYTKKDIISTSKRYKSPTQFEILKSRSSSTEKEEVSFPVVKSAYSSSSKALQSKSSLLGKDVSSSKNSSSSQLKTTILKSLSPDKQSIVVPSKNVSLSSHSNLLSFQNEQLQTKCKITSQIKKNTKSKILKEEDSSITEKYMPSKRASSTKREQTDTLESTAVPSLMSQKVTPKSTLSKKIAFSHHESTSVRESSTSSSRQLHVYVSKPEDVGIPVERGRQKKRDELTKIPRQIKSTRKKEQSFSMPDTSASDHPKKHLSKQDTSILPITFKQKYPNIDTIPAPYSIPTQDNHKSPESPLDSEICLPTPVASIPSPDPSPSVKSVLDKSITIASERKTKIERRMSPSPSASPVKSVARSDRYTSAVDLSQSSPSLPSSPSRVRGQQQAGVTQLLTSEVFTRTVDASGSIEVIYRQPTVSEALRRVAVASGTRSVLESVFVPGETEVSLIDTTDSSLSDSVALPSSSSDHDLSMDTNVRVRGTSASPKHTRRSLDLIHDAAGSKLRSSDLLLDYSTVIEDKTVHSIDPLIQKKETSSDSVAVPKYSSKVSPTKPSKQPSPLKSSQVSEERLSPILDVRAVTPPRVKHKFDYMEEETSSDAAFPSSPEWTETSQDLKTEEVKPEEEEDGADTQPEVASARLQTTQTRVVGDDGFITTVTTVTQQRESPDNSDLQELLDKLAQEKH